MASDTNPVPTPADLARDLAADLAVVEKATAGWDIASDIAAGHEY